MHFPCVLSWRWRKMGWVGCELGTWHGVATHITSSLQYGW